MGVSKNNLFTEEQNALAAIAKSLGHPARIAIVQHLLKADECVNGTLVEVTGLSQATVSQHLKELVNNQVLKSTKIGTSVCYCINQTYWEEMQQMFNSLFDNESICKIQKCN
ncbi:MAG: metalloregulator ArsR/SmtB family transcription factor [Crocinitomicaceae bacterium]